MPVTLALGGGANTVTSKVLVHPISPAGDGVVVKAPDSAWGDESVVPYGNGQAFMLLKEDTTGAVEPDDLVMFRVSNKGSVGIAGGIHCAAGFRQRPGDTVAYGMKVELHQDIPGILITAFNTTPTQPYQQWMLSDGTVIAEINSAGVLKANRSLEVHSPDTSTPAVLQVGTGSGSAEAQLCVAGAANNFLTGSVAGDAILKASTAGTGVLLIGSNTSPVIGVGSGSKLGFFATAPSAKKSVTGSRAGNAALASLLTQLAAYGLITDSSSA